MRGTDTAGSYRSGGPFCPRSPDPVWADKAILCENAFPGKPTSSVSLQSCSRLLAAGCFWQVEGFLGFSIS